MTSCVVRMVLPGMVPRSESFEHELASSLAGFQLSMCASQVGRRNRPERLRRSGEVLSGVDECCDFVQNLSQLLFLSVAAGRNRCRAHFVPWRSSVLTPPGRRVGSR